MYNYNYCEHESYLDENVNERILRYALIRFTLTWCVTWFTYYVQLLYKKERVFFYIVYICCIIIFRKTRRAVVSIYYFLYCYVKYKMRLRPYLLFYRSEK